MVPATVGMPPAAAHDPEGDPPCSPRPLPSLSSSPQLRSASSATCPPLPSAATCGSRRRATSGPTPPTPTATDPRPHPRPGDGPLRPASAWGRPLFYLRWINGCWRSAQPRWRARSISASAMELQRAVAMCATDATRSCVGSRPGTVDRKTGRVRHGPRR